jgi:hypothetical protein
MVARWSLSGALRAGVTRGGGAVHPASAVLVFIAATGWG